jgi:hypothetical protein
MADVSSNLKDWSTTASTNNPAGTTTIGGGLDDNLREIQACIRGDLATKGSDIASASTADLGAIQGVMHDITGTTTITSFGTVSAGIWKIVKFEGALTLTHNATSLILLTGANRVTVAGDVGMYMSEGSGNWRELFYMAVPSSYTGTLNGCTTSPNGTINYTRNGNSVTIDVPSFTGTSNGASKTVTGMPASIRPATNKKFSCFTSDNGGSYIAAIGDLATDGTLEYTTSASGGIWTTSGTATIQKMCFTYTLT